MKKNVGRYVKLFLFVPWDSHKSYDVREVIARLVDGSDFHEFKALYRSL